MKGSSPSEMEVVLSIVLGTTHGSCQIVWHGECTGTSSLVRRRLPAAFHDLRGDVLFVLLSCEERARSIGRGSNALTKISAEPGASSLTYRSLKTLDKQRRNAASRPILNYGSIGLLKEE